MIANSHEVAAYEAFVTAPVPVRFGPFAVTLTVEGWVRDGLMTLFFLVVGLEVKYEVLRGEFSSPRRLAAPVIAAFGGMAGPAIVYLTLNNGLRGAPQAWAIPTPTDVAFALAALGIFGRGLPQSLRLFVLTLAVADDIVAVLLIAVLYHAPLHAEPLAAAGATLAVLAVLSRWRRAPRLFYAAGFVVCWAFTLKSGLSPSIAGFACALTTPVDPRRADQASVLKTFMDGLHPYVAYVVLPLFAFTSAGIPFTHLGWRDLLAPAPLGVALGLALGKPAGIFLAVAGSLASRLGRRPLGATWIEVFGVACLCGAGFTVSFFLADLALEGVQREAARVAVIAGSLAAVAAGALVLRHARRQRLEAGEGLLEDG
ncbi:MAG TPA: Na+/H+ antiporter NhaA [Caulobacteraceae bacterium]